MAMSTNGTNDKVTAFPKERKARPQRKPRQPIIANIEAERNTLGSLMLAPAGDEDAWQALELLRPEDFYEPKHQLICGAMQAIRAEGRPFGNLVLINAHLSANGQLKDAGGQAYVSSLPNAIETSVEVLEYARVVFTTSIKRQTQTISIEGAQLDLAPDELAARLQALIQRQSHADQRLTTLPGRRLSDVQREAVRWAWTGRAAYGKTTMLDGDGGKGKGLITMHLIACATTGQPMPGDTVAAPPMNVILIAPEDSAADTLRPRLEAAGGDPTRVRLLDQIETIDEHGAPSLRPFAIPSDVPLLEEVILRENAGLVVIDPIMSCLDAGVKTGIDNEVRAALMPLKQVIERTGAVCILVRHFTKSSETRAAYRGGGSVAFTNIARFGLIVADHPDNPEMGILALAKSNYAKVGPLAYRIVPGGGDVRVEWDERASLNIDADALLAARGSSERREIVDILEDAAPAWLSIKEIARRLREPIPEPTLRKRLSRYADARAIQSRPGEGLYAALSVDTTPQEEMSQVSYQSQVSQVSQVSQYARLGKQSDCDSVTVVTGSLREGKGVTTDVTGLRGGCEHPLHARHRLKSGLTCGLCNARLDDDLTGAS